MGKKSTKAADSKKPPFKKWKIKKSAAGRGNYRSNNLSIIKGKEPFPFKMFVKSAYGDYQTLTGGTSGLTGTEQAYNLNSIYDCDRTGTGHQSYGHDVLALIYNKYKVYGVLVDLAFSDPSADGIAVVVKVSPDTSQQDTTTLALSTLTEQPNVVVYPLNNTGSQVKRVKFYLPMWKAAQLTKLQFNSDISNYSAAMSANPTITPVLRINTGSLAGASSGTVRVHVKLTYYVECFNRLTMAQS